VSIIIEHQTSIM